jgi:hypothetical protein
MQKPSPAAGADEPHPPPPSLNPVYIGGATKRGPMAGARFSPSVARIGVRRADLTSSTWPAATEGASGAGDDTAE